MLSVLKASDELAIKLDLLKATLNLSGTDKYDEVLKKMIRDATAKVEEYTQRTIVNKTWKYTHTHSVLHLPRPAIRKVIEVQSNGVTLAETEYKKGFTRDTIVIILNEKYANNTNTVIYEAGYGEEIPDLLKNVIFDCAKVLFHQGIGVDSNANEYLDKVLSNTSYSQKIYCNERVDSRQQEHMLRASWQR